MVIMRHSVYIITTAQFLVKQSLRSRGDKRARFKREIGHNYTIIIGLIRSNSEIIDTCTERNIAAISVTYRDLVERRRRREWIYLPAIAASWKPPTWRVDEPRRYRFYAIN